MKAWKCLSQAALGDHQSHPLGDKGSQVLKQGQGVTWPLVNLSQVS